MGRSVNSFTSFVGHAEETISDDRVTLPEKDLWVAVLCRAVLDACKGPPELDMAKQANIPHKNLYGYNRRAAQHFFLEGGKHFNLICEMAGRNPKYVQEKARKLILRENGWNVDVPITSHYRGSKKGRGRPRKKNLKMVLRGSKGGRPRLYVL